MICSLYYDQPSLTLLPLPKQSINDPGAFIVLHDPSFPANIMPRIYGDIFTDDELDLLVDYILSADK
jgi:hypothetical protein